MLDENTLLLQLSKNRNIIDRILSTFPINIASENENKLRFDTYEHKSHAYSLDLNNLTYFNFRENEKGTLFDLISKFYKKDKQTVINEIYLSLILNNNFDVNLNNQEIEYEDNYKLEYPEAYDEQELDKYSKCASKLFLDDGLWLSTQYYWGIRYDYKYKRIVIPVYQDGDLVGAIGRLNKTKIKDEENKYMPILPYSKSKVLFGLDIYKEKIKELKKVILVESEKSVMKAYQLGFKIPVLAVGCSNISRHHIERLNILGVKTIIWSQDKGIENKNVLPENLKKLKKYSTAKYIKYINPDEIDLLDDKESVLDKDKKTIEIIFKNYVRKY